jgi:glucose-1-phosphate thymidylyltransferase
VFDKGRLVRIEEKPKKPKSPYAQIGVYMYDAHVFDYIRTLKPSPRGELEITDLNNIYVRKKAMDHRIIKGYWVDAGTTIDSLFQASSFIAGRRGQAADRVGIEE